jgi:hypothetical protein
VSPRHYKLLVLLLPLLILRSVLPAGFMLSFDGGAPRIVFCSGQLAAPSDASHGPDRAHLAGHGQEHHHGGDHSNNHSSGHDRQVCPFALAASAPLAFSSDFAPEHLSAEASVDAPDSAFVVVAFQTHPIRGPPRLS